MRIQRHLVRLYICVIFSMGAHYHWGGEHVQNRSIVVEGQTVHSESMPTGRTCQRQDCNSLAIDQAVRYREQGDMYHS